MSANKDFDTIMLEITSGLTGDHEKDIPYLMEQCEKYKEHEFGKEIARACGRLIYEVLPEDKKEELNQMHGNGLQGIDSVLEETRFNIYKKNFDKALQLIESVIGKIENLDFYQDDTVSEYHTFNNFFEEALYRFRNEPKKDLRRADGPLSDAYLLYGSLLIELKRFEDAKIALKKALRWNPIDFNITSEYTEIFKITRDLDTFYKLTLDAFKIAYHPETLARCYRNLGFYFIEKKLYPEATVCYLLSMNFSSDNKQAQSELYYIQSLNNGKLKTPSEKEVKEFSEKYGFPTGSDRDILSLAYSYGMHLREQGIYDAAKFCFEILYNLVKDPEIKKMIDNLP